MKLWLREIAALGACEGALDWAENYETLEAAWAACERGDWMLWLAEEFAGPPGSDSRRPLVLAACGCARLERGVSASLRVLEIAEQWARREGGIMLDDVIAAVYGDAATAAYFAASDAVYAARAAAAHAWGAYWGADAAEKEDILRQCANIMRQHFPLPPKRE